MGRDRWHLPPLIRCIFGRDACARARERPARGTTSSLRSASRVRAPNLMMAVPKLGRKYGIGDFGVARGQEACPLPPCHRHRLSPESAASSGANAGFPSIAPLLASYVM